MTLSADLRRALASGAAITVFSVLGAIVPTYIWLQIDPVIDHASIYISCIVLPLIIAPACGFFILRARMRADRLARENHRLATVDELTDLPNRRAFFAAAEGLQAAAGLHRLFVCAIADIDNFKRVNDQHGHDAGDRVLASAGAVFKAMTPPSAIIARLGGEEFAMAGVFGDLPAAHAFCEAMVRRIEAEAGVTVSLGYCAAADGDTVSTLMSHADHALYRAKQAGKNRALGAHMDWPQKVRAAH